MARTVPGLILQRREIAAGPLKVVIETDGRGRLRKVSLPRQVPGGFLPRHLRSLIDKLGRWKVAVDDLPPFHRKVWERMRKIPWGSTMTYGGLAGAVGHPKASRAVGQACGANPLTLLIPCHRILGLHGPGGFAYGLEWKMKLLELESGQRSGS